jgi:hypothetical protein
MFPWSKTPLKFEVKIWFFTENTSLLHTQSQFIVRIAGNINALCGQSKEILMLKQAVHIVTAVLQTVKIRPGIRTPIYIKIIFQTFLCS